MGALAEAVDVVTYLDPPIPEALHRGGAADLVAPTAIQVRRETGDLDGVRAHMLGGPSPVLVDVRMARRPRAA